MRDYASCQSRSESSHASSFTRRCAARDSGADSSWRSNGMREHNVSLLRLDTRADLVEARGLYAALGYREVSAFNSGPYAEHWFAKKLLNMIP